MSGLSDRLAEILKKMESKTLVVGFMENATYPDGTSVAMIAAKNEYGGTFTMPAHDVTVYRKIDSQGGFAKGGRFVKRKDSNFSTTHHVEAHEITTPPRPFFRQMVTNESPTWAAKIGNSLIAANYDGDVALGMVGEDVKGALQESINTFTTPELAQSTIAKKGGVNKPLIDTGHMLNSVAYEIRDHD